HPHPHHVGVLPADVLLAHVDVAVEAEPRAHRGAGHAVLPGAGLGYDPPLAQPLGQQRLPDRVVDLVRAGVVQVLALQVDAGAVRVLLQPLGAVERGRPPHVVARQPVEALVECRIRPGRVPGRQQLVQRSHYGLGHEAAAEVSEAAAGVGHGAHVASFALRMKRRMRSGSLMPGELSTPRAVSTAHGRAVRTASATLSGSRLPARITGARTPAARSQCARSVSSSGVESRGRSSSTGTSSGRSPPGSPRMPTIVRLLGWAKRPYTWTRLNLSHEWRWTAVSA